MNEGLNTHQRHHAWFHLDVCQSFTKMKGPIKHTNPVACPEALGGGRRLSALSLQERALVRRAPHLSLPSAKEYDLHPTWAPPFLFLFRKGTSVHADSPGLPEGPRYLYRAVGVGL